VATLHPLHRSSERKRQIVVLRRRLKTLDIRIWRLKKQRVPIATELQALIFETSAEHWRTRETKADCEADDIQVWLLRDKGFKE
jgi:hypothetical protein